MRGPVVVALVCLALGAPAATADPGQWALTGSGVGSGGLTGDHVMVGAHSEAGGADPTGAAESSGTVFGTDTFLNVGGHVVCLAVDGNKAIAVWKLRTPAVVPGRIPYDYAGVYVEDNGEPVDGRPVDRMDDFILHTPNLQFFCGVDPAQFFAAADAQPLLSGNFVVRDGA